MRGFSWGLIIVFFLLLAANMAAYQVTDNKYLNLIGDGFPNLVVGTPDPTPKPQPPIYRKLLRYENTTDEIQHVVVDGIPYDKEPGGIITTWVEVIFADTGKVWGKYELGGETLWIEIY